MLTEIGSWRRHESSGSFVASRLPEEREANLPEAHYREFAGGRVLRVCKHYAVTQRLAASFGGTRQAVQTGFVRRLRSFQSP
jgi:hypothetical protein